MSDAPSRPPPRITLVTFGHLRPTHEGADGSAFELAEQLAGADRLAAVLCYAADPAATAALGGRVVTPGRRPFAVVGLLAERIARLWPRAGRRLREAAFDRLVARSAALRGAEVVVFRKPNFAASAKALRRRGIPSVAISSILPPRMNHDRVAAEAARFGLRDRSPYTDRARMRRIERFFSLCDRVLTSERVGREAFLAYGIPERRIATAPLMNGADCVRFAPRPGPRAPGPLRVLHLSSMNLIKGVGFLFEAWRDLDPADAELVLGGAMDESTRAVFERIAPPACRLLGPVADTPACYRDADLFVSPSLSDNAPNTVLEALASGVPVIVSDACGASELVEDGRSGWVYPWNQPAALAERLAWCLANRDRLAGMGAAARAAAQRHPRGDFGAAVVGAVDALVAAGRARGDGG